MVRLPSVNPWKRWVGHSNDWIICKLDWIHLCDITCRLCMIDWRCTDTEFKITMSMSIQHKSHEKTVSRSQHNVTILKFFSAAVRQKREGWNLLPFWGQGRKSIDWVRALMCWKLSWEAEAWPRPAIGWSVADLGLWLADQSAAPRYRQSSANHQSVIESISDQQSLASLVTPRSRDPGPDSRCCCDQAWPENKIW